MRSTLFDKTTKAMQQSKNSLFKNWHWNNWASTWEKNESRHRLTPFTKVNSEWIIELNGKCKTIKLMEDNIRRT